ncbi:unnamed protein product [Phytomonas sp. EM1]|nr:unnamed protein product [Phytomonas sp. EM1]|eukprot:CCW61655.1 unnamed protein product [Phytomonas sp. isolate EM1]
MPTALESLSRSSTEAPPLVKLLILITGSVAAVKTGLLLDQLAGEHCSIRIATTKSALHFLHRAEPSKTGIPFQSILTDEQEWATWQRMNDAIVHIELRRWADLVVIVPLDANTLAKLANGLCDNLVSSVMRAWEVQRKPVILCPSMNTAMWMHPITARHLAELRGWYAVEGKGKGKEEGEDPSTAGEGAPPVSPLPKTLAEAMFQVVNPVSKRLACGDIGIGGMAPPEEIAAVITQTMALIREKKLSEMAASELTN